MSSDGLKQRHWPKPLSRLGVCVAAAMFCYDAMRVFLIIIGIVLGTTAIFTAAFFARVAYANYVVYPGYLEKAEKVNDHRYASGLAQVVTAEFRIDVGEARYYATTRVVCASRAIAAPFTLTGGPAYFDSYEAVKSEPLQVRLSGNSHYVVERIGSICSYFLRKQRRVPPYGEFQAFLSGSVLINRGDSRDQCTFPLSREGTSYGGIVTYAPVIKSVRLEPIRNQFSPEEYTTDRYQTSEHESDLRGTYIATSGRRFSIDPGRHCLSSGKINQPPCLDVDDMVDPPCRANQILS